MMRSGSPSPRFVLPALAAFLLLGCNDSGTKTANGPEESGLPKCGPLPYFTVIPLPEDKILATDVIGRLGAPMQTLPKRHPGVMLTERGVPIVAPGDIYLWTIRRNRYVVSNWRQGEEDYAVHFNVCKDVYGYFGHVGTLDSTTFPVVEWEQCNTYETANETIEACEMFGNDMPIKAGQPLGTAGIPASDAVDFGLMDRRANHLYAAPDRFDGEFRYAVSQFTYYDSASQDFFYQKLYDPGDAQTSAPSPGDDRPGDHQPLASTGLRPDWGEPRFGTMAVDVPGTAQGNWAEPGGDWSVVSEQHRFVTLANNPYRPSAELMLSLGPDSLGAWTYRAPRQTTGRVNRAFSDITPGSGIYCYFGGGLSGDMVTHQTSWLVELLSEDSLRIERRTHAMDATPCTADPSTWAFGSGAMTLVR